MDTDDDPRDVRRRRTATFRSLESGHVWFVGRPLVPVLGDDATREEWLYEQCPFPVLAHDNGVVPLFVYANRAAQVCFDYGWDEIVGIPSSMTAGPEDQDDRDRVLRDVRCRGFTDGYRGLRVSATGRRFWVKDVLLWTLLDADGEPCGQAAWIRRWHDAVRAHRTSA